MFYFSDIYIAKIRLKKSSSSSFWLSNEQEHERGWKKPPRQIMLIVLTCIWINPASKLCCDFNPGTQYFSSVHIFNIVFLIKTITLNCCLDIRFSHLMKVLKSALCDFGEYMLIERERSALTKHFYTIANEINKLILMVQHVIFFFFKTMWHYDIFVLCWSSAC